MPPGVLEQQYIQQYSWYSDGGDEISLNFVEKARVRLRTATFCPRELMRAQLVVVINVCLLIDLNRKHTLVDLFKCVPKVN